MVIICGYKDWSSSEAYTSCNLHTYESSIGLSSKGLKCSCIKVSSYFVVGYSGRLKSSLESVGFELGSLESLPPTLGSYLTAKGLSEILKIHKFFPQCLKATQYFLGTKRARAHYLSPGAQHFQVRSSSGRKFRT